MRANRTAEASNPVGVSEIERRIVGRSAAIQLLRERVTALARLTVPVLIRGDAGTGRSHVAATLHAAAAGRAGRLVSVDGSEAPAPLPSGTLLIEGVESLPPAQQARWSELLHRAEAGGLGAPRRILATAASDLSRLVEEGHFDRELYARLERFALELPALRERREDVPLLVRALGERAAGAMGRERVGWSREALRLLAAQPWTRNVRELASMVERLVAFDTRGRIGRAEVAALLDERRLGVAGSRRGALERQREELAGAIEAAGGNLAEVARRLEMSRGGVIYRAQKFGLLPSRTGEGRGPRQAS